MTEHVGEEFICNDCGFMHVFAVDARVDPQQKYFGQP